MSRWCGGQERPVRAIVCAVIASAIGAVTHAASAFELKHTSHGQTLHWGTPEVSYVIDPSVQERVSGGSAAVSTAVGGWSRTGEGPSLSTRVGGGGAKPGLDGQNSVILAPQGFAPAGAALAVTVTSYDDDSGIVVDSDIVINGVYAFAVLDASAHAAKGATPFDTDGPSSDDDSARPVLFDLVHVVSHEVGHTLGLADESEDHSSLMYAFTMPNDASIRTPSSDDIQGVASLYGSAGSRGPGCGQSSIAGSRTRPADAWVSMILATGVGLRLVSRRRSRGAARLIFPVGVALFALLAWSDPARSATPAFAARADAVARVATISTSNEDGLFVTTLDLVPTACQHDPCPERATAHTWGGTLGGITQRVGGGDVPSVGDAVDIAFVESSSERGESTALQAAVLAVRR